MKEELIKIVKMLPEIEKGIKLSKKRSRSSIVGYKIKKSGRNWY